MVRAAWRSMIEGSLVVLSLPTTSCFWTDAA
jgi:hypothetical protein